MTAIEMVEQQVSKAGLPFGKVLIWLRPVQQQLTYLG